MAKKHYTRWADLLIFGLVIFLVFCLIFESFLKLPNFVVWIGHWHPLLLHFPIVLLLLAAVVGLIGKKVSSLLLTIAALSALFTAISGFFLATGTDPKGDTLYWHQLLGTGVAILAALWYWLNTYTRENSYLIKGIQLSLIGLVGFTGHYGGMITHGEDFLAFPKEEKLEEIPENPLIYEHVVARVLDNKCVSCHNPDKRKGQLLLTNLKGLSSGGETGPAFVTGKPEQSELIRRLRLPIEDEEHMPPEGKSPLTEKEINILERWIALGASDTLRLSHLDHNEPLMAMVKSMMALSDSPTRAPLPKIADSILQDFSSDHVTIRRVAGNSEALSVSLFLPPEYDPKIILNLRKIVLNIVELDLSGLPLGEKEMEFVALCKNLERMEIDRSGIKDHELLKLKGFDNLIYLKAYSTDLTDESLAAIKTFKNLKELYIWDTQVTSVGLSQIRIALPNLIINTGIDKEAKTLFVENDSV